MLQRMLVILVLAAGIAHASAQVYNPATPVVPSLPPPPIPPSAQPGMAPPPAVIGRSSASSQPGVIGRSSANPPRGVSPGIAAPARETHNDRSIRCAHQGAALGVPPSARGQYIAECVNN